jgi:hypothetical protein
MYIVHVVGLQLDFLGILKILWGNMFLCKNELGHYLYKVWISYPKIMQIFMSGRSNPDQDWLALNADQTGSGFGISFELFMFRYNSGRVYLDGFKFFLIFGFRISYVSTYS